MEVEVKVEVEVEVEVKEVDMIKGESGGIQVRDRLIPHRFKEKFHLFFSRRERFL